MSGDISAFSGNISAFSGNISAFSGNISAFGGNISAFGGNISAFSGNISAFEGEVNPFWGNISAFNTPGGNYNKLVSAYGGNVGPFMGNISAFWGTVQPTMGNISAFGGLASALTLGEQINVADNIKVLASFSENQWGRAVTAITGKSFDAAFLQPLYTKYGIDPDDLSTLSDFSQAQRNAFLLDWYDGLMNHTGTDRTDWWMNASKWTPLLTQTQGSSAKTVVGLLDSSIAKAGDLKGSLTKYDGVSTFTNGHGAAVASLIVSAHDGKGVMGIAPQSSVVAYNPFDSTMTANWSDVTTGVQMLLKNGARVVNMSLGEPKSTLPSGWYNVFSNSTVAAAAKNTVFVIAAGNDGHTQTSGVRMNYNNGGFALLVVGSVGPNEQISSFSNRPGTASLLDGTSFKERLMDRFLVAPGEGILVSDGADGVVRRSGTSFAAPLVSGAVALMIDRWPWMSQHPHEIANVILKTAKDLGAPGNDPIYGAGLLDIEGSQSPIDFNNLKIYQLKKGTTYDRFQAGDDADDFFGPMDQVDVGKLKTPTSTALATWETQGLYFHAYEQLNNTYRDFAIPLSQRLVGKTVQSAGGTQEVFQRYVYGRMVDWLQGGAGTAKDNDDDGKKGKGYLADGDEFSFTSNGGEVVSTPFGVNLAVSTKAWRPQIGYMASQVPVQTDMKLITSDRRHAFRFGYGDGAGALTGMSGFAMTTDSSHDLGGANPVLGLASGGAYGKWSTALSPRFSFSAGYSQVRQRLDLNQLAGQDRAAMAYMGDYRASAGHASLTYKAAKGLELTGGMTSLREPNALLGTRSLNGGDLGGGSRTDAATFGATWTVGDGLRLSATGTLGRTSSAGAAGLLATADGGLKTSAYQFALDKAGLFSGDDVARLTLSQPLTVENGKLAFTDVQVVNRQTGRLGVVTQTVDARQADRRYVAEVLYGRSTMAGAGEWGLFGRAQNRSNFTGRTGPELMAGARFKLTY